MSERGTSASCWRKALCACCSGALAFAKPRKDARLKLRHVCAGPAYDTRALCAASAAGDSARKVRLRLVAAVEAARGAVVVAAARGAADARR